MTEFLLQHWIEIFAVITGLLYVYLQIKQNKTMWIVGFISSAVFVYILFSAQIYAQMGIYVYYVGISVYGFWKWSKMSRAEVVIPNVVRDLDSNRSFAEFMLSWGEVLRMTNKSTFVLIIISLLLSTIITIILSNFTDSPIPIIDGTIAGFSIVATWMVTQKIIQHWYFWMAINLACVVLYVSQNLYFTGVMFLVYFVMSIIGLREWKKTIACVPAVP